MKKKPSLFLRRALILLIAALALALLCFVLWRAFGRSGETSPVDLPLPRGDEDTAPSTAPVLPQAADVTPETVLAVLRTIPQVRSYSRVLMVDVFWEGGAGSDVIICWARGDELRLRSGDRELLSTPQGLWVWYSNSKKAFAAAAARAEHSRLMRILDWETLLTEPDSEITAAAYTEFEGERCVYVAVRGGAFGYVSELYVSLDTGLLIAADSFEGEKCVYRMRAVSQDISTPDESLFIPPV